MREKIMHLLTSRVSQNKFHRGHESMTVAFDGEGADYTEAIKTINGKKFRIRTARTFFPNPYHYGQVEYWLYEWIAGSKNWYEAVAKRRRR